MTDDTFADSWSGTNTEGLTLEEWFYAANPQKAEYHYGRGDMRGVVTTLRAMTHGYYQEYVAWYKGEDPTDWRSRANGQEPS